MAFADVLCGGCELGGFCAKAPTAIVIAIAPHVAVQILAFIILPPVLRVKADGFATLGPRRDSICFRLDAAVRVLRGVVNSSIVPRAERPSACPRDGRCVKE